MEIVIKKNNIVVVFFILTLFPFKTFSITDDFFPLSSSAGGREAVRVHSAHTAANTAPLRAGLPPPQKQPAVQGGGGVTGDQIEPEWAETLARSTWSA